MKKLNRKLRALVHAEEAVIAELERLYPIDTPVSVWLMHGQINPSEGRVIGHQGGRHGLVIVRLASRTQDTRRVAASNIVQPY